MVTNLQVRFNLNGDKIWTQSELDELADANNTTFQAFLEGAYATSTELLEDGNQAVADGNDKIETANLAYEREHAKILQVRNDCVSDGQQQVSQGNKMLVKSNRLTRLLKKAGFSSNGHNNGHEA